MQRFLEEAIGETVALEQGRIFRAEQKSIDKKSVADLPTILPLIPFVPTTKKSPERTMTKSSRSQESHAGGDAVPMGRKVAFCSIFVLLFFQLRLHQQSKKAFDLMFENLPGGALEFIVSSGANKITTAAVATSDTSGNTTIHVPVGTNDENIMNNNNNDETKKVYWEPIPEFPDWMNDYFAWHKEQRAKLDADDNNYLHNNHRFLVLRCLAGRDKQCGGFADRMQNFLLGILFASLSNRILLIYWNQPAELEEFLVPPVDGLDWRVPAWMLHDDEVKLAPAPWLNLDRVQKERPATSQLEPVLTSNATVVWMRHQQFWPMFYDNQRKHGEERSYEDIFHDVWQRLFKPSPPVAALIDKTMQDLDIAVNKYVAVHVRAMYKSDKSGDNATIYKSINCASQLRPGWPIYFASDSTQAIETALAYGQSVGGRVVARVDDKEPLHLDKGDAYLVHSERVTERSEFLPSDYYSVFVDMYLLANSQCVSRGIGGYGRMGSMLSFNRTCSVDYRSRQCAWTPGKNNSSSITTR